MTDSKFDRTLQAVSGYIKNNCPDNILVFGRKFSPDQTIASLNWQRHNYQEIQERINEYKSYIKLQIRFMNKTIYPEAFTYFCTLNGLLSELLRAINVTETINQ